MPNPNNITERLFQSPSKYIQGPSAIHNAAHYLGQLGRAPLLLSDALVYDIGMSLWSVRHTVLIYRTQPERRSPLLSRHTASPSPVASSAARRLPRRSSV